MIPAVRACGADVHARVSGHRPLHLAATNHAGLDIVADLLYASPSAVRTVDNTAAYLPLHCAAQSGADADVIVGLLKVVKAILEEEEEVLLYSMIL